MLTYIYFYLLVFILINKLLLFACLYNYLLICTYTYLYLLVFILV